MFKPKNSFLRKEFAKNLSNKHIKVISFDIFDTLIFRKVNSPTDIFNKMSSHTLIKKLFGQETNFKQLRIIAEENARKTSSKEEITLTEIYSEFKYLTIHQQQKLLKFELKMEQKFLVINHEIEKWIKLALAHDKKVILISDMYLTKKQILKIILKDLKCLDKIDNIFVSSDLYKTKHIGTMYDYVLEQYEIKPTEMLHIGDNFFSDVASSNNKNINALYYHYDYMYTEQIKHEKLYQCISKDTLSIKNLVVMNNPYINDKKRFFYNFGATIAGPIFWSFSHWLIQLCLKNNFYDIGFILRDGKIFKQYFSAILKQKNLENNFNLKEIHTSRKALYLPTITEKNYNLNHLNLDFYRNWKIEDFYTQLGLTISNKNVLKHKNKSVYDIKDSKTLMELIIQDLNDNINQILHNKENQLKLFLEYWESLNMTETSILFDFGANATIHKIIAELTHKNYINVLFYRTQLGCENGFNQLQYTYIPYTEKNKYKIELLRSCPDIFEILFNGTLETTLGYQKNTNKVTPIIDSNVTIEDTSIIKAFTKGIENYFNFATHYNQKEDIFTPQDILNLMTRVIEFPTIHEVKYLGKLPINISQDASKKVSLISQESKEKLAEIGIQQALDNLKINLYKNWQYIPWTHGTITSLDYKFIQQRYTIQENPNETNLNKLLQKIDLQNITEVSIYGTGEFFLILLPELLSRNIRINYLIETKPTKREFYGYKILSPEEIAQTEQSNFIIASVAFSSIMKEILISHFEQKNKNITHLFYIDTKEN